MPNRKAQIYSMACSCGCHQAVGDGFVVPDMDGCTAAMCQCGRSKLRPVNAFSVSSSGNNIGRIDHHTAFKPIICDNSSATFNDNNNGILSQSFNILTLNDIRSDTLDALSPERTNNTLDALQACSRADCTPQPKTPRTTFITPNDLTLKSSESATPSSGKNGHCNSKLSVKRSIFSEVSLPAELGCLGRPRPSSSRSSLARPGSRGSSRTTPLTFDELTNRLVAPDEFLPYTDHAYANNNTHENGPRQHDNSEYSSLFESTGTAPSTSLLCHHPRSVASNDLNLGTSSMTLSHATSAPDSPLGAFLSSFLQSAKNPLLPNIPGGSDIKHRLIKPDPSVVEKLLQLKGEGSDSTENDASDPKAVNQTVISLDEMHYKTPDAEKPYIAVFWDIENCQVPRNMDASSIVKSVRSKFYGHHMEYEFFVVMDVYKEKEEITKELQRSQVTVVHVCKGEKNAADEKLIYLMRRYSNYHKTGNSCILISGDTNFVTVLHDMRHKNHINIILLHNNVANDQLKSVAHFNFNYSIVTDDGVHRPGTNPVSRLPQEVEYHTEAKFLAIHGLPNMDYKVIKNKLHMLCENLGGKVFQVYAPHAFIDMRDANAAIRAKSRLDDETVYQNQICCTITSACSLNNFHQAQLNGTVEHSCAVDDNIALHDNNCPRFNAPHNTHNYNKLGNHGGLQGWGQGGNGGHYRGQPGLGFNGSNGCFNGSNGGFNGANCGGFAGAIGGFGSASGGFGGALGGFGSGSGGFGGTNGGRGSGMFAGGGDPCNYSASKKIPNSYGAPGTDRSVLSYPRQNSVPSDDFQPFDLLDDGGIGSAFLACEGRNGGSPSGNGATNRHFNGSNSARKALHPPGNNRTQGNGYYQSSHPISVPNLGGFFDCSDDTLLE